MKGPRLEIHDFAQIKRASIQFGDLTVLVGEQATGKSLILQWLKTVLDGRYICDALRDAGQSPTPDAIIDLIFGIGMQTAWRKTTRIKLDGRVIPPAAIPRRGNDHETLFFVPAQRAMLISDGWATPFQRLTLDPPVVARLFSQTLFERFNVRSSTQLFPNRAIKKAYRELLDDTVYHGGTVHIEQEQLTKRLRLKFAGERETSLPFMAWTAGQRELTPLVLGLYDVLPVKKQKADHIDWIVIEEPEMGLHPEAVTVVMLLVLDLLSRGYRVVLSTHSPAVITAAWALRQLAKNKASYQLVCDAFAVPPQHRAAMRPIMETALEKSIATYVMQYDGKQTVATDISSLDPGNEDDTISEWGGLSGFASRFGAAVSSAVNQLSMRKR